METKSSSTASRADGRGALTDIQSGMSPAAERAYEDARISGLCHEGAMEIAAGIMRQESDGRLSSSSPSTKEDRLPKESDAETIED